MQDEKLCKFCLRYDLQEWFLPCSVDGPDEEQVLDPDGPGIRLNVRYAFENQDRCTFCMLIVNSLWLNPQCKGNTFSHERSHVRLTLYKIGAISVATIPGEMTQSDTQKKQLHTSDTYSRRIVRYLKIHAYDASGTSWGLPVGNSYMTQVYLKHEDAPIKSSNLLCTSGPPAPFIDFARARYFMDTCRKHHSNTCSLMAVGHPLDMSLRVIDVHHMMIIWLPHNVSYAALSYCWGPSSNNQSHLVTANKAKLFEPGSLLELITLPRTIANAITVCRNLDIEYLWVDALCIIQDDVEDKMTQINQMDKIYMYADITIVAAGGDNAGCGLHGIGTKYRSFTSIEQSLDNLTLCSWYPPESAHDRTISTSPWTNRAWTLQEQILSRRRLVFGQYQMVWHCEATYWPETFTIAEAHGLPNTKVQLGELPTRGQNLPTDASAFQKFNSILAEASSRKLGYEEDRLLCIQGILNVLSADFPAGYLWGLPRDTFDSSLLFCASAFGAGAPYDRRAGFPSWSWSGWKVQVNCSVTSPYMYGFSTIEGEPGPLTLRPETRDPSWLRKDVAFHTLNSDTMKWKPILSKAISNRDSFFFKDSLARWSTLDLDKLQQHTIAKFFEYSIPIEHVLAFWTQTAYLEVDQIVHREFMQRFDEVARRGPVVKQPGHLGRDDSNPGWGYAVRGADKQIIGYVSLKKDYREKQPKQLRFMVISHNCRWVPYGYGPFLDLMHIEERHGITYRVQLMHDSTVTVDLWQKSEPTWECVVMA